MSGGGDDSESARGAYWDGFYVIGQALQTSPVDNEEHTRNFYQSYETPSGLLPPLLCVGIRMVVLSH